MLQKVTYPDDAGGDRGYVKYAYNAQSQLLWTEDQATNVLENVYDTSGRETARKVTTLASGFDGAVERIERSYDLLGRVETVVQYDSPSGGSATDGVKYSYDNWGNLERFEQDRNSAVGASGSVDDYEVSYAHAKASGGRVALRRSSMTLPSGKAITVTYSSFRGLFDDDASRVSSVADGSLTLANWIYNGVGQVVGASYPEPNVASRLVDPNTAGSYPGLDRFNRMVNCYWQRDLTTPRKFYDISISWDKNSNITVIDDAVHSGFDVEYTNDYNNRLIKATEGTWSGSAITSKKREQEWTELSHTGNWDRVTLNLNCEFDSDFTDPGEYDDTRTHNAVNEILTGTGYSVSYDKNGNLTDDGKEYKYEWDAFNRLVKIRDRGDSSLVEEFRYNGLGFRIGWHADSEPDGDVDSNDPWHYPVYDPAWRMLALYRGTETTPREEFVPHLGGNSGFGGSSLLDGLILRYRDTNGDGTLEEKRYYCQNFRGDVSAIVTSGGALSEWVKYSPYGIPFGLPAGDTDSDGDCDATDAAQIQTWINTSAYDVRGDLDLDGDVDTTDKSTAETPGTVTLGWLVLSSSSVLNRRGYAGYEIGEVDSNLWHVRNRALDSLSGRWLQRDPLGYVDSLSLPEYAKASPIRFIDPLGLIIPWGWIANVLGGGLNDAEQAEADRGGPFELSDVKDAASTARSISNQLVGRATLSAADAMRHCMYACELTSKIGVDRAFAWLSAHERGSGQSDRELQQDLRNNREGQLCWDTIRQGLVKDCLECCWHKLITNQLDLGADTVASISFAWPNQKKFIVWVPFKDAVRPVFSDVGFH